MMKKYMMILAVAGLLVGCKTESDVGGTSEQSTSVGSGSSYPSATESGSVSTNGMGGTSTHDAHSATNGSSQPNLDDNLDDSSNTQTNEAKPFGTLGPQ